MNNSQQGCFPGANIPKFNICLQQTKIFKQVAAYDFGGPGMILTGGDHPQVQGIHVSTGYFALFGAPVAEGRTFTTAEDNPQGGNIVVLSYGLWKSRYGGNPKIVGSNIQLDGQPCMGSKASVFKISTSRVPWSRSMDGGMLPPEVRQ